MNDLIQKLFGIRHEIDILKREKLKELEATKKELESKIFEKLDELGVDGATLKNVGTVGINQSIVPQAEDWDKVYEYILRDKLNFCLLNKALNAAAYRESLLIEGEIPGIKPFIRRTLSVRKL